MSKLKVLSNDSSGMSPGSYYRTMEAIVDINSEEDVSKWASNLGVTVKELKEAIGNYGSVVSHIRKGLLLEKNKSA